jgi:hypothetical protein
MRSVQVQQSQTQKALLQKPKPRAVEGTNVKSARQHFSVQTMSDATFWFTLKTQLITVRLAVRVSRVSHSSNVISSLSIQRTGIRSGNMNVPTRAAM